MTSVGQLGLYSRQTDYHINLNVVLFFTCDIKLKFRSFRNASLISKQFTISVFLLTTTTTTTTTTIIIIITTTTTTTFVLIEYHLPREHEINVKALSV
jgi:hypothetical protein